MAGKGDRKDIRISYDRVNRWWMYGECNSYCREKVRLVCSPL